MKRTTSANRTTSAQAFVSACFIVGLSACTGTIANPAGINGSSTSGGSRSGTSGSGTGVGTGGTGVGAGSGAGGSGSGGFACQSTTAQPGPSPMHLLSSEQYLNTVRDLLGDIPNLSASLDAGGADAALGLVQADIAQVDLERFQNAAELAGSSTVTNAAKMKTLAPCATGADKRVCAKTFVQTFGSQAYRAPLTDAADIDRHLALYDAGATTSYEHGIEMVLRGMLQAPRFLYRVEIGTLEQMGPDAVKLSGYEVASRLSYAVWNTMPDAKLTAAAASGGLSTKDGVVTQLKWMLADPRGAKVVQRFLETWVRLADVDTVVKDSQLFPDWTGAPLRTALKGQARAFFDDVLTNRAGSLSALLTSPTVFVNKSVAGYYGVTATSDAFQGVDRTDGTASGLLTLPGLLATLAKPDESSPIYRGKFVREQLLCQELPPPPPNVPKAPDTQPGVSTREKFRQHETDPACSSCHTLMDPIGFGFENFDAVGRYRTLDNGAKIDTSGELFNTADIDGKFMGVAELGKKLAGSSEVQACVGRQWFRFFLSRFEQEVDNCSMKSIVDTLRAANNDLNSLPLALVQTDAFLYRRPLDSKVGP